MHRLLPYLVVILASMPAASHAQAPSSREFRLPSAEEVATAIETLCAGESQGVTLGFAAREAGRSLDSVVARMAEPTDPALKSIFRGIRQTVEDVYAHPSVGYSAMFYYRSHVCFRERTELRALPSIVFSVAALARCEREHGREGSPPLQACVKKAVYEL